MNPDGFTSERTYLRITPSTDPLQPDQIARTITHLHRSATGTNTPTYEWLFAATGDTNTTGDRQIEWYVGTDGTLDHVKRTLRHALPDSVDLVETDCTHRATVNNPTTETDDWEVAAVEWNGIGDRPADCSVHSPPSPNSASTTRTRPATGHS